MKLLQRSLLFLLLCLSAPAWPVPAFDADSFGTVGSTSPISWTHTPSGTPRGIIVQCVQNNATSTITGVTYGGGGITQVTTGVTEASPYEANDGAVSSWFIGSSVPTGAQTVEVTFTGTVTTLCVAVSLTSGGNDLQVQEQHGSTASFSGDSDTLGPIALSGVSSFVMETFRHGDANVPTNVSPLTGWTAINSEDFGNEGGGGYRYDTVDTADVTYGADCCSDSWTFLAIAISEETGGGGGNTSLRRRRN